MWYLIALAIFVYLYLYFKNEKDKKEIYNEVEEHIYSFLENKINANELRKKIYIAIRVNKIPDDKEEKIINEILDRIIAKITKDKFLTFDKIDKLEELCNAFNYKINSKIKKQIELSNIINKLVLTKEIDEYNYARTLPVVLKENEKLINVLNDVALEKTVKHTRYEGGSSGVSVRIAKGMYYRTGSMRGKRIVDEQDEIIDIGSLFLTSENLYFIGTKEKVKIPYKQIVTLEPHYDAITISKSGNVKPVTFVTSDAWFVYALIKQILKYDLN